MSRIGAAVICHGWLSLALLYWVVLRFVAKPFLRKLHPHNRKTRAYHRLRQSFLQCQGSGNLSIQGVQTLPRSHAQGQGQGPRSIVSSPSRVRKLVNTRNLNSTRVTGFDHSSVLDSTHCYATMVTDGWIGLGCSVIGCPFAWSGSGTHSACSGIPHVVFVFRQNLFIRLGYRYGKSLKWALSYMTAVVRLRWSCTIERMWKSKLHTSSCYVMHSYSSREYWRP